MTPPSRLDGCVFCDIVARKSPATIVHEWDDAIAIVPLNPVTEGHVLVLPKIHAVDALHHPATTGAVMEHAADLAPYPCNLITSCGNDATQTISHLHIHIVPRRPADGLALPWDSHHG